MERLKLPEGWIVSINGSVWGKPYGGFNRKANPPRIYVYPPKWIPVFMQGPFIDMTYNHECLHVHGNPGCRRFWCLGFEGTKKEEYAAFIPQLLGGFRFCDDCMGHYKGEK